jgi:hypothetical protein
VHNCVAPFTSNGKLNEFGAKKLISQAKLAHFDCFVINFTVWSHILLLLYHTTAYSNVLSKLQMNNGLMDGHFIL